MTELNKFLVNNKIILLVHPFLVDKSKICFELAKRIKINFENYHIITTNSIEFTNNLKNNINDKNIRFYNYSNADSLLRLKNDLIIIDNLEDAKTLQDNNKFDFITQLLKNNNNVIILTTFGLTQKDLNNFTNIFTSTTVFWASFVDKPFILKRIVHKTKMTSRQENLYDIIRDEEIKDNSNDTNFKYSQRICNIDLPDTISHLIDTDDEPSVNEMMNQFINSSNNNSFDFKTFLQDAPKIKDLIEKIKQFSNEKQVIYTRYNKHYGVQMLKILFEYLEYKVFSSISTMTKQQHLQEIENFNNEENPCIYITSFTFTHNYNLYNITQLHLLNSDSHVLHSLLDIMFKYRLYVDKKYKLTVHSYICENNNNNLNADSITFKNFVESQKTLITLWETVSQKATSLFINSEDGLIYF
jgi:hypothetical protein